MKWLLVLCGLTTVALLGGCCSPGGGLFSSQGSYGASYPANYYPAPAASTYATNPCNCQ